MYPKYCRAVQERKGHDAVCAYSHSALRVDSSRERELGLHRTVYWGLLAPGAPLSY